jgi:co-chaperonin GroES (HSP10)
MKIRPVNDRILVKPFKAPEMRGSLFLPEQAQGEVLAGIVDAVGPGKGFEGPGRTLHFTPIAKATLTQELEEGSRALLEAMATEPVAIVVHERSALQVSIGDVVVFGRYSGAKVEAFGRELFLLREDELLAVVEDVPQDWIDKNEDILKAGQLGVQEASDIMGVDPGAGGVVVGLDGKELTVLDDEPGDEPPPLVRLE